MEILDIVREALWTVILVAAPLVGAGLVVAVAVGIVQAATGIHEPLVALVPRVAAMAAVLLVALPWMIERLVDLLVHAAGPAP